MEYKFRPIDKWPRAMTPGKERRVSPFKTSLDKTWRQLDAELRHLKAKEPIVVQVALDEKYIRLDGRPRADAPDPKHPGVIIAFDAKIGGANPAPLKFVCDACTRWQDNIRAITLTLERLRLADLYGVTKAGEQYTGWRALPGPIITPPAMTVEEAARSVGHAIGIIDDASIIGSVETFKMSYRAACAKLHPDAGGNAAAWQQLQQAADVLKRHHGIA
jgi:hypothetical protein